MVLCVRNDTTTIFLTGYAKKAKGNLSHDEEKVVRKLAAKYLSMSSEALATALRQGELLEISCEPEGDQDSAT